MVAGFLSNQTQPQGCLQPGRNLISSSNKIDEIWKINTPFCLNKLVLKIYVNSNIFLNFTKKKIQSKGFSFYMKLFLWSLKFKLNVKCSFSNCNFTFHSTYAVPKCNCRNCAEKLSNLGHESMKICRKIVKSNKWCAGKIYLRSAYVAYNEFAVHNRRNSNYKISFCASELLLTTGAQFKWLNIFFIT